MTKSLQDLSLRGYQESGSPERLTKRLSQLTFRIDTLLTRTKHRLSDASPDDRDPK